MDFVNSLWQPVAGALTGERIAMLIRVSVILVVALIVARTLRRALARSLRDHLKPQQLMLARAVSAAVVYGLALVWSLAELGFQPSVLLGAAGIVTVAVGFASQTAVSNLISGLFLIFERPFEVGDQIRVEDVTGEVLSVDLMAVKVRTFDNLYVRIPNESMLKAQVTTLTRFAIRRVDVVVGVAYREELGRVQEVLLRVAADNPLCLEEPKPVILFTGYGDSSVDLQVSVWAPRESFLQVKNALYVGIKGALDAAGIEIPFPHRSLYAGAASEPLPVRLVEGSPPRSPGTGRRTSP